MLLLPVTTGSAKRSQRSSSCAHPAELSIIIGNISCHRDSRAEGESAEGGASKARTSVRGGAREMVEVRGTGYFNYHAVPGNLASLRSFRLQVIRRWMCALRRRSQKSRMTWPRLVAIADRWLPKPSILHPYLNLRFDAKHPKKGRMQQSCTCGGLRQLASLPRPRIPAAAGILDATIREFFTPITALLRWS
jgi:hypothetical protein